MKAMSSAGSFRGEGSFGAWLRQIARNTLVDWHGEKARLHIPVASVPDHHIEDDPATATALANEERILIREVVDELPEAQREVVQLRYWKDLTIDEIARFTGRTRGAIRVLLHRARQSLRRRLNAKEVTALLGATGAAASVAFLTVHRHRRRRP